MQQFSASRASHVNSVVDRVLGMIAVALSRSGSPLPPTTATLTPALQCANEWPALSPECGYFVSYRHAAQCNIA